MLTPLTIRPGVFRNGTRYQASGRWWETNLVRWHNQQLRPVGGWERINRVSTDGIPRALFSWLGASQAKRLAIGTNTKLYVSDGGNAVDVTPVGFVAGLPDTLRGLGYGSLDYGIQ